MWMHQKIALLSGETSQVTQAQGRALAVGDLVHGAGAAGKARRLGVQEAIGLFRKEVFSKIQRPETW